MNKMWMGTELFNGCFGNLFSQNDVDRIINHAQEIGVNKIDTAECYNVEKIIGNSLKNKKNSFKVATKFGHEFNGNQKINSFSLDSVKKQLKKSLELLDLDYIDLYYFHSGSNFDFNNDDLWDYLNKQVQKGVIGSLGLSIQHSLVIDEDYFQINKAKDYGISVVQTVLNKHSAESLKYLIPYCKNNNIKVFGRMPLAKGLLSGKYDINHKFNENDVRSKSKDLNQKIISHSSRNSYHSALSWCRDHVDEVVIGSKNDNQLEENNNLINKLSFH